MTLAWLGSWGERIIPKILQGNSLVSREIRSIQRVMDRIPRQLNASGKAAL
jgi:hypothetical protein